MSQVSGKLRRADGGILMFWCPGCEEVHQVRTGPNGWGFNGDFDNPTFTPSVLVTSGHFSPGHQGNCWCTFEQRTGMACDFKCHRCHTFVTDGQIQFLSDCSHALAGQTVPLPDLPSHLTD
jgi:hypothetical protein